MKIITGLWSGKKFDFKGKHYRMKSTVFLPTPKQRPRIPIWVGGFWPRKGPFIRAAKWDGVLPLRVPEKLPQPEDLREIMQFIEKRLKDRGRFDVATIGWTTGNRTRDSEKLAKYKDAGMTWWLESLYTKRDSPDGMQTTIRRGPPGTDF